jgi:hypothetical protein
MEPKSPTCTLSLTPSQANAVAQITALRRYTLVSGFRTGRSEREILAKLNAEDLGQVLLALEKNELLGKSSERKGQ